MKSLEAMNINDFDYLLFLLFTFSCVVCSRLLPATAYATPNPEHVKYVFWQQSLAPANYPQLSLAERLRLIS